MLKINKIKEIDNKASLLVFGDNLEVMKKLLPIYEGKIDLIYIDPPYNTKQTFTVSEKRSSTISREKMGTVAYSDSYSLDEYLKFLEKRLKLLYRLLSDNGSIYLHIDYKIGHYVKILMDKIFGIQNFKNDITRIKSNPKNFDRKAWSNEKDMILFYSKNSSLNIWNYVKLPLTENEILRRFNKKDDRGYYTTVPLHAPGETNNGGTGKSWKGLLPPAGRHWRVSPEKLDELDEKGLIEWSKTGNPRLKKYAEDHKGKVYQDVWCFKDPQYPIYPTEKNEEMIELIIKQSSNEDSIVMDCFCGSGITLKCANSLGRKFVGIDCSKLAIEVTQSSLGEIDYQYLNMDKTISKMK